MPSALAHLLQLVVVAAVVVAAAASAVVLSWRLPFSKLI
jgi:hypothetical protein